MPPTTGSGCPEIDALPEFLQDIPRELYQLSLTEEHTEIFREACKNHSGGLVNAKIIGRFGGADDFLDSREINNVYRSRTASRH